MCELCAWFLRFPLNFASAKLIRQPSNWAEAGLGLSYPQSLGPAHLQEGMPDQEGRQKGGREQQVHVAAPEGPSAAVSVAATSLQPALHSLCFLPIQLPSKG